MNPDTQDTCDEEGDRPTIETPVFDADDEPTLVTHVPEVRKASPLACLAVLAGSTALSWALIIATVMHFHH